MTDESTRMKPIVFFDLESQTIDSLELTLEKLQSAVGNPADWKWVIVGLHSALHGSFGIALRRSDGAQLLVPKQERATYEGWERERETGVPEETWFDRTDWFLELYKKTLDPQRMSYLGGIPLEPTDQQTKSMEKLNSYRGELIHFSAISMGINLENVTQILRDSIPILRFMFNRSPGGSFTNQAEQSRSEELLDQIEEQTSVIGLLLRKEPQSHSQ